MNAKIAAALEDCGALQFGEFILASGAKSDYYIDIKKASTRPKVLQLIADEMQKEMDARGIRPDRIAGVVLGSIPLATALSLRTGIPLLMVRKERKDHGTGRLVEGELREGDSVLVVEDVITTAGSSLKAIGELRGEGADVRYVMSVIDREGGGRENLAAAGIEFLPLVTGSEVLKGRR